MCDTKNMCDINYVLLYKLIGVNPGRMGVTTPRILAEGRGSQGVARGSWVGL